MKKPLSSKAIFIVLFLMLVSVSYAQKLQKIKGSKIVNLTEISLDSVNSIELYKGINLILKKGEEPKFTIFADDNLHHVVDLDLNDGKLSLSLLKRITSKKKFELTLYLKDLNSIILNDDSTLTNLDFFDVDELNIELNNKAELTCLFNGEMIVFEANDSSKSESNLKAKTINYNLQDRVRIKGISNADITKIIAGGKSSITISGKSEETFITATQSSILKLNNLINKITEVMVEDKSNIFINTTEDLTISAKGDAKVYIYGNSEIDLIDFKDKATLIKKE